MPPEEILILQEEGKLPKSVSSLVTDEEPIDEKITLDYPSEVLEIKDLERRGEEMLDTTKGKDEVVPKERASITSNKHGDFNPTRQPHGSRGKEHKGKHKKV
jgi:hypothetical protein